MDTPQGIALFLATITMGIGAGVYLLYAFVIMPGLRKTDDRTFVGAFQQIDRAIVGPFLLVFFFGPLAFAALSAVLMLDADRSIVGLITSAVVIQVVMLGMTIGINVPLNNGIKAAGEPAKIDVASVRRQFNESRWVRANNVRAIASTAAFASLAWALMLYGGF